MIKSDLGKLRYSPAQITAKREKVRRELIGRSGHLSGGRITCICRRDLKVLFDLYDEVFFRDYFQRYFQGKLIFSLSPRMTRNAGMTLYSRNLSSLSPQEERYDIRIGVNLFFNYERLERDKVVNGIKTRDGLEALLLVFEHELCHLVELHCYRESSCRRERFQTLAFNIFGHVESCHQLPLMPEIAAAEYDLSVGDQVSFQGDGRTYNGIISRITRRATVMVPDAEGTFQDNAGRRYCKYYVPLSMLEKGDPPPQL